MSQNGNKPVEKVVMLKSEQKALGILVSVAKALLYEVDAGGDLGYHLNVPEYAGRLCEALTLLGISLPKSFDDWADWKAKNDDN